MTLDFAVHLKNQIGYIKNEKRTKKLKGKKIEGGEGERVGREKTLLDFCIGILSRNAEDGQSSKFRKELFSSAGHILHHPSML